MQARGGVVLGGQVNRIPPAMPVQNYVTWQVTAPAGPGFWRAATCEEVDCPRHLNGWVSKIDETTTLGQQQAGYIRRDRTRRHTEETGPDGLTWFRFPAGQACYEASQHRIRNDRPPLYVVRGGDWRATTTAPRIYDRDDQWVTDFAEHQQRLAAAQQ